MRLARRSHCRLGQCEDVQLVLKFCEKNGIAHRGIGPIRFYQVARSAPPAARHHDVVTGRASQRRSSKASTPTPRYDWRGGCARPPQGAAVALTLPLSGRTAQRAQGGRGDRSGTAACARRRCWLPGRWKARYATQIALLCGPETVCAGRARRSVAGVSNADVARAIGAPVLHVGRPGERAVLAQLLSSCALRALTCSWCRYRRCH